MIKTARHSKCSVSKTEGRVQFVVHRFRGLSMIGALALATLFLRQTKYAVVAGFGELPHTLTQNNKNK
jgi:hypothetical protein